MTYSLISQLAYNSVEQKVSETVIGTRDSVAFKSWLHLSMYIRVVKRISDTQWNQRIKWSKHIDVESVRAERVTHEQFRNALYLLPFIVSFSLISFLVFFFFVFFYVLGSKSQPVRHVRSTRSLPARRYLHQHGHGSRLRMQESRLWRTVLWER